MVYLFTIILNCTMFGIVLFCMCGLCFFIYEDIIKPQIMKIKKYRRIKRKKD